MVGKIRRLSQPMKTMLVFCFETYGDLVDQWITFNEPIVPVEFGYFYDAHYPQELVEILHEHGLLPDATEEELEVIRDNTVDFLGVNYYQPLRVMAPRFAKNPESPLLPEHFYEPYVCLDVKLILTVAGKFMSKGFMISPKISRKTMAISSGS